MEIQIEVTNILGEDVDLSEANWFWIVDGVQREQISFNSETNYVIINPKIEPGNYIHEIKVVTPVKTAILYLGELVID
jgi:hypothetical protein